MYFLECGLIYVCVCTDDMHMMTTHAATSHTLCCVCCSIPFIFSSLFLNLFFVPLAQMWMKQLGLCKPKAPAAPTSNAETASCSSAPDTSAPSCSAPDTKAPSSSAPDTKSVAAQALQAAKAATLLPSQQNKVTVVETRRFAGKDITLEQVVDADSKLAKKAATQPAAGSSGACGDEGDDTVCMCFSWSMCFFGGVCMCFLGGLSMCFWSCVYAIKQVLHVHTGSAAYMCTMYT